MRAAKLTNGIVTDLWEVPSLDCYASEGITLIEAPDFVGMGATYDGTTFVNAPPPPDTRTYQQKRVTEYPPIGDQLDALFHAGVFPAEMAAAIQAVKDKYPKETPNV